jgi:hypothetical protein
MSLRKPARGKFVAAISHVLSAKDAKDKHLFRRQLGAKFRIEIAPRRLGEGVSIATLHLVVDGYDFTRLVITKILLLDLHRTICVSRAAWPLSTIPLECRFRVKARSGQLSQSRRLKLSKQTSRSAAPLRFRARKRQMHRSKSASYSITSSATVSSAGGMARLGTLALAYISDECQSSASLWRLGRRASGIDRSASRVNWRGLPRRVGARHRGAWRRDAEPPYSSPQLVSSSKPLTQPSSLVFKFDPGICSSTLEEISAPKQ